MCKKKVGIPNVVVNINDLPAGNNLIRQLWHIVIFTEDPSQEAIINHLCINSTEKGYNL